MWFSCDLQCFWKDCFYFLKRFSPVTFNAWPLLLSSFHWVYSKCSTSVSGTILRATARKRVIVGCDSVQCWWALISVIPCKFKLIDTKAEILMSRRREAGCTAVFDAVLSFRLYEQPSDCDCSVCWLLPVWAVTVSWFLRRCVWGQRQLLLQPSFNGCDGGSGMIKAAFVSSHPTLRKGRQSIPSGRKLGGEFVAGMVRQASLN